MAERNKTGSSERNKYVICLTNTDVIRLLAACIVGAYILFCIGYFKGKQAVPEKACSVTQGGTMKSKLNLEQACLLRLEHKHEAQRLMQRLEQEGLVVDLQPHVSLDSYGNRIDWYQIITKNFTNQEELVKLVERIRYQEAFVGNVTLSEC